MLPEAFLNELKYNTDIEQVISRYVQLRRRGRNLTGLCPFHSEKSPSFTVYPETQSFYCFGCGAGGDAITFLRKIENLDYMEAVRSLAERAGMAVPEGAVDDGSRQRRTRLLELNRAAARHFHQNLMSGVGQNARAYLVDRGLTRSTVVRFGIGFAPESWDDLRGHLREKGFTDEEMIAAALENPGKNGGCYDAFRNRVIFPIIDLRGNVIAFGGRNLGDKGPKYLNSGDTMVFKKSRNLFALNFAKNTKRPELILCEGYMDVVSVHQGGFDNAVATLGTALTPEQAKLISSYTKTVVLSYDSDGPGQAATRRAISVFEDTGVKVRVLSIPDAKDPDEFLKKFGPQRFELLLEGSSGAIDFEIQKLHQRFDTDSPEGRVGFLQELVRLLAGLGSPIQREVYLSKVCRELEVDKQAVALQLETALRRKKKGQEKREARELRPFTSHQLSAKTDIEKQKYPKFVLAEERLIAYLIRSPDAWDWVKTELSEGDLVSQKDREIYRVIAGRLEAGLSISLMSLSGELPEESIARLSEILASPGSENISPREAEDYIRTLKGFHTEKTSAEIGSMEEEDLRKYIASIAAKKK
ncbi:MAG: DNA primase [Angelakisella sp.]|nr:DNA primase [Angelakisella sp.]